MPNIAKIIANAQTIFFLLTLVHTFYVDMKCCWGKCVRRHLL